MPPLNTSAEDPPGKEQFRAATMSSDTVVEPDTEVIVTDEAVAAHPLPEADAESPIEFVHPLDEIQRLQCDGFVCRSMTIDAEGERDELSMRGFDEGVFRRSIVEHSDLNNSCIRPYIDRLGVCPCEVGTTVGCVFCAVGFAVALSVVGAVVGAGLITLGLGLLILAYAARKCGKIRGANVWERTGSDADLVT